MWLVAMMLFSKGFVWSPAGVGVPSVNPPEVCPNTGPFRDLYCPKSQMTDHPCSWGQVGMQKGLGLRRFPKGVTLLRMVTPQPLVGSILPCSDQTPTVGVVKTGEAGSYPSHLTVYVVLFFVFQCLQKDFLPR